MATSTTLLLLSACVADVSPEPKKLGWSEKENSVIFPKRCPDWRQSASVNYGNNVMSNYGCASAVNLGYMVANPRDVYRGRGITEDKETENSVTAIQRLNRGEITQKAVDLKLVTTKE